MDFNTFFIEQHSSVFIEARLESARNYRYGTGSAPVAMIGRAAAALRRLAAAVEGWARPSGERVVSVRQLPSR